ncbi:YhcN/YlaJ family sporulation lipoprotein [Brevibacillus ruminantium]|uniref:YhcN/YlaJ family sporulation lipoprotein n=1 Tax=Brevibacillus ruminantium TaxID=2950604 RepID=A0ABY4WNU9_9BACL|nr:YhcN/YlaJ family sporulation lipoprotein [Brevibacillus ruminantium]USG67525.1 YhcN/YlaJ family sporulation lipoprotein [Brevibacillus ruminantium]
MTVKRTAILVFSVSLLLSACMTGNKPPANQAAPQPNKRADERQRVQQTAPSPAYNQSPQATADRLVQLASRVPNVNGATAVVLGKYAVVGINVNPHLDRPEVGVIKYSVAEALKEDPQGATALVTADPGLVQRVREMAADMRRGRPIAGIAEELGDVVGRIIPQAPSNVKKKEEPPTRENEQRINKSGKSRPEGNHKIPVNRQ